jgi:predicted ATPase
MPITVLSIAGYRSVRDLSIPLKALNVLTGPNGCGKSNLYNAVFLLAKTASGGFAKSIADEGGMGSVVWAGQRETRSQSSAKTKPVRVVLGVKTDQFGYELSCGLPPYNPADCCYYDPRGYSKPRAFVLDPEVKGERVWIEDGRSKPVTFFKRDNSGTWVLDTSGRRVSYSGELSTAEGILSQLREPHLYPELSALAVEMNQWRFYHHFPTDRESPIRRPQVGVRTPVLSHDGTDLAAALQTILEIGDGEGLLEEVARAFNGADLIIDYPKPLPPNAPPELRKEGFSIFLKNPGLSRLLTAAELSDGTLRYLCLLAALMSPRPPKLLALNEPETSLHPDLLDGLARMIVRASNYSQMWITTHSTKLAELIEEHSGEPAIRLELVNGETKVVGQKVLGRKERRDESEALDASE